MTNIYTTYKFGVNKLVKKLKLLLSKNAHLKCNKRFIFQIIRKCFEHSIHQRIHKKINKSLFTEKVARLFSTLKIMLMFLIKVSLAPNQYIRMISEGSCDTEVWRVMMLKIQLFNIVL